VDSVEFEFSATDAFGDPVEPPLSWHLTAAQKAILLQVWKQKREIAEQRAEFKRLFGP
jgi:hypothetical protein